MSTDIKLKEEDFLKIGSAIYGTYRIPIDLKPMIDIPEFQRLGDVFQLGSTPSTIPEACHNRKTHSFGVCHLAIKIMLFFAKQQPELQITQRDIILVGFFSLYHDSGHCITSHLMDHMILPALYKKAQLEQIQKNKDEKDEKGTDRKCQDRFSVGSIQEYFNNAEDHEKRAIQLIYFLRAKYKWDFTDQEMKFISDVIQGKYESNNKVEYPYPEFMYRLINNTDCGFDVDKCNYIDADMRSVGLRASFDYEKIINGLRVHPETKQLWFDIKIKNTLFKLAMDRYNLHQDIYQHATVKKVDSMYKNLLLEVDEQVNFRKLFTDDQCGWLKLTNGLLWDIQYSDKYSSKAKMLLQRIQTRQFYKMDKGSYYNQGMKLQRQRSISVSPERKVIDKSSLDDKKSSSVSNELNKPSELNESNAEVVVATVSMFGGKISESQHYFENMKFYKYNNQTKQHEYLGKQSWYYLPFYHRQTYLIYPD